jgi:hypothetical protein
MFNREWHLKNKFPKEGSEEEKNSWRKNHKKNCDCGNR